MYIPPVNHRSQQIMCLLDWRNWHDPSVDSTGALEPASRSMATEQGRFTRKRPLTLMLLGDQHKGQKSPFEID